MVYRTLTIHGPAALYSSLLSLEQEATSTAAAARKEASAHKVSPWTQKLSEITAVRFRLNEYENVLGLSKALRVNIVDAGQMKTRLRYLQDKL